MAIEMEKVFVAEFIARPSIAWIKHPGKVQGKKVFQLL